MASINKIMKQAGKDIPSADLVVGSATIYNRGGKLYLSGTVHNQSSRIYPRVHVVFDTFDSQRNPAGTVEADVNDLQPEKEGAFEIGPLNPAVVSFLVRWIQPFQ